MRLPRQMILPFLQLMRFYWKILRQTVANFYKDDAMRLSAALAYYSAFSLAPLLVICVAMAGAVLGEEAARGQLDDYLKSSLGTSGAFALQAMVANARVPDTNVSVSVAGVVMLVIGAGGLFGQLQVALNTVWGVKPRPGLGIRGMLKERFLSFSMVLGAGFLLLTSMVLSAVIQAMSKWIGALAGLPPQVWAGMDAFVSFGVIAILFAAIFKGTT